MPDSRMSCSVCVLSLWSHSIFMSLGWFHYRGGCWHTEKLSNLPKISQLGSCRSRIQTQNQSWSYNLYSLGESAGKGSGLGLQRGTQVQIWLPLARQISLSALGPASCTDRCICLLWPHSSSSQPPRQLPWDRESGEAQCRHRVGTQESLHISQKSGWPSRARPCVLGFPAPKSTWFFLQGWLSLARLIKAPWHIVS